MPSVTSMYCCYIMYRQNVCAFQRCEGPSQITSEVNGNMCMFRVKIELIELIKYNDLFSKVPLHCFKDTVGFFFFLSHTDFFLNISMLEGCQNLVWYSKIIFKNLPLYHGILKTEKYKCSEIFTQLIQLKSRANQHLNIPKYCLQKWCLSW